MGKAKGRRAVRRHYGTLADICKAAESVGWEVHFCKGANHWRFRAPDTDAQLFTGGTPSDWRSLRNLTAQLRRNGCPI